MTPAQQHRIETLLIQYRTDFVHSVVPQHFDPAMVQFWNAASVPSDLTSDEASRVISAMVVHNPNNLYHMMETQPDWATGAILRRFAQ